MGKKTALVLSGGGARGAYQAGVLKGLAEILKTLKIEHPFQIYSGVSAGAINAAKIAASSSEDFSSSIEKLVYLWSQIKADQVYKVNLFPLNKLGIGNFFSKPSGTEKKYNSILDTQPLKAMMSDFINFDQIQKNIDNKRFESLIITANDYHNAAAVSYISSSLKNLEDKIKWNDSRRIPKVTKIALEHVMASSAIPVLFPPVLIDNHDHGDGCVRNTTPCSPSLRLGAEKLFVVGVRTNMIYQPSKLSSDTPQLASFVTIINALLNAVMLDSVEQDVYRILRINELVKKANVKEKNAKLKEIPTLMISPTVDIGEVSRQYSHRLPRLLRSSLNAFGSLDDAQELVSYLMFDAEFCRKLINFGYDDVYQQKEEVIRFFQEDKTKDGDSTI